MYLIILTGYYLIILVCTCVYIRKVDKCKCTRVVDHRAKVAG